MSSANQDFNAENLVRGNSALGAENPAFEDQRKAGNRDVAITDIEDALLLASKYTVSELSRMTNRSRTQIESMLKLSITKIAKARGVERAEIKGAFDDAQQANGVNIRRYRETSVTGAVGDANGRQFSFDSNGNGNGNASVDRRDDATEDGIEDVAMGGKEDLFEEAGEQQEPGAPLAGPGSVALAVRQAVHQLSEDAVEATAAAFEANRPVVQEDPTEEEDAAFTMLKLAGVLKMTWGD